MAECFRWYLTCALTLCNLEEIMAERSITIRHFSGKRTARTIYQKQMVLRRMIYSAMR